MPSLCSLARQCPPAVRCPCVFVVPASSLSPRRRCPHVIVVRCRRYSCIVVVPVSLLSLCRCCPRVIVVPGSSLSARHRCPVSSLSLRRRCPRSFPGVRCPCVGVRCWLVMPFVISASISPYEQWLAGGVVALCDVASRRRRCPEIGPVATL
jgi:hypothetical protein